MMKHPGAGTRRMPIPFTSIGSAVPILLALAVSIVPRASFGRQSATSGNPHGALAVACENCHTTTSWVPIRPAPDFSHNATPFPLRGLHTSVDCRQCHASLVFSDVGARCADCHADIHRRQFGSDCEQCHTVRGWDVKLQSVNEHQNRFPLLGAHRAVDCQSCHKDAAVGVFRGLDTSCVSCHQADFQNTTAPDHEQSNFPTNCELCHTMNSWLGVAFDHSKFAGFTLTGAHAQLACESCHAGGKFAGTPADCFSCHAADYNGTSDPNHTAAGFPKDCSICHTTASWSSAVFDHSTTGFSLTGVHTTLTCGQCHADNHYDGTPTNCVSCHLNDYNSTSDPNHASAGFSQNCESCHSTAGWDGASFDHSKTAFPLTGAHTTVSCAQCHADNRFAGTSTQCVSCHLADYDRTNDPNHAAAGFPQTCDTCHTTTNWSGAAFDHSTTGFILGGAHQTVTCIQCHAGNKFQGTPTDCASCHKDVYDTTTNPNHTQAGFPTDCSICHSTNSWQGAVFDHSNTQFPLTGAHNALQCTDCHASGQYANLPTACVSCHLAQFNRTINPNHVTAGFPQDCAICHSTTAWSPASFDHANTAFPLTGAHTTVACANCHLNGQYATTPTNCYACHSQEYGATTDPNHAAAGFPTTCQICHTTTTWSGATFDHTWFPMTHGRARVCSDCHTNPSNYTIFVCTSCHTQNSTNSEHSGVGGYVYNSTNCYQCHPNGRSGGLAWVPHETF